MKYIQTIFLRRKVFLLILFGVTNKVSGQNSFVAAYTPDSSAYFTLNFNKMILNSDKQLICLGERGYLTAIDTSGIVLWSKKYSIDCALSDNSVEWRDIVQLPNGFFMICGRIAYQCDFSDHWKSFLICTDKEGNPLWAEYITGYSYSQTGLQLVTTWDNAVILAGTIDSDNPCTVPYTKDGFIEKIDSSGNVVWTRIVNIPDVAPFYYLLKTPDSCFTILACETPNYIIENDLAKFDTYGNFLWFKKVYSGQFVQNMVVKNSGGFLLTGGWKLINLDKNGNLEWCDTHFTNIIFLYFFPMADCSFLMAGSNFGGGDQQPLLVVCDSNENFSVARKLLNSDNNYDLTSCGTPVLLNNEIYCLSGSAFIGLAKFSLKDTINCDYEPFNIATDSATEITEDRLIIVATPPDSFFLPVACSAQSMLISLNTHFVCGGIATSNNGLDVGNEMLNCYPNPFSHQTSISLPYNGIYQLRVLNVMGKIVEKQSQQSASSMKVSFGEKCPSGIYFAELQFGNTRKFFKVIKVD